MPQPSAPPPVAPRLAFEHALLTDEAGRIVSVVEGAVPEDISALPRAPAPAAVSLARHIGMAGLLPPRAASLRELVGGHLLSVAGDRAILHAQYAEPPPRDQAMLLLRAVLDLESAYAAHLGDPASPDSIYSAVRGRIARVFSGASRVAMGPPAAVRVFVHASIEPRGPGVLAVLRIRNFTRAPVRGVSVAFASPKDFLRPAALYGTGAAVDTSAVRLLEELKPGEKVLELRLEPQEPRTGPLQLTLKGPDGREVPARPLTVAVKFPRVEAPRPDAVLLSRQLAMREEDPRDVFRLRFTRAVAPAFAFERVQEAVARERPMKLMEFSAPAPSYHEAWYLGTIAPAGAPLLVEVAVRGPGRLIEIRVATRALDDLLGVKAEYRRRVRELLSERFMGKRAVVQRSDTLPPSVEESAPHLHSTLLLKHLEGEISAGELWRELRRTATGGSGEGWQFVAPFADELMEAPQAKTGARRPPRPPRLGGKQAQEELLGGIADSFNKLIAPIVLAQTARMVRTGARLKTGLDRAAEAEAEAAED